MKNYRYFDNDGNGVHSNTEILKDLLVSPDFSFIKTEVLENKADIAIMVHLLNEKTIKRIIKGIFLPYRDASQIASRQFCLSLLSANIPISTTSEKGDILRIADRIITQSKFIPRVQLFYKSFLSWLKCNSDIEVINTERKIITKRTCDLPPFGNTIDLEYNKNNKRYVLDYKTPNRIPFSARLQLAGYSDAVKSELNESTIVKRRVLQLKETGSGSSFNQIEYRDSIDFDIFRSCVRFHEFWFKQKKTIGSYGNASVMTDDPRNLYGILQDFNLNKKVEKDKRFERIVGDMMKVWLFRKQISDSPL